MNGAIDPLYPLSASMGHDLIARDDIMSRYVLGHLDTDQERRFEAHLVECEECQSAVEAETALRNGLRDLAATAPLLEAGRPRRRPSRWSAITGDRRLDVAAVLLLGLSAILGVKLVQTSAARDAARSAAAFEHARAEDARRNVETPSSSSHGAVDPVAPVATFVLVSTRGRFDPSEPPINRIQIPPGIRQVVLTMDLPAGDATERLDASLRDSGTGAVTWSGGPWARTSADTVSIAVDAGLLSSTDYELHLERRSGARPFSSMFRFRVTKAVTQ